MDEDTQKQDVENEVDDSNVNYFEDAYTNDIEEDGSEENVAERLTELNKAKSEEDVDAFLEKMEKDPQEEGEQDKEEENQEKELDDNDDPLEKNPPEVDKDEDKVHLIDDDFIENYSEKADLKILEKLKGRRLDNESLKMLINAQRLVGKKSPFEQANKEPEYDEINEDNPIPKNIPRQKELEDGTLREKIDAETLRRLKADERFADLPDTIEELEEWKIDVNADNPDKLYDFRNARNEVSKEVESAINKGIFIQKNSQKVNNAILKKEANSIISELKEYGINDLADAGVDLSFTTDEKGNLRNPLMEELLLNGNDLDDSVVTFIGDKPLILEGTLRNKFLRLKGKTLFQQAIKAAEKRAKVEKFENLENKKKKTLNSFTESGANVNSGKQRFEDILEGNDQAAIDSVLEKIEGRN